MNSTMDSPQISIVMPSYQQAAYLEEAVRSVLDQEGVAVELLVMDPGSTDGSRELLRELEMEYGERLQLHFAPDKGQSDAINRGMALARGNVLAWLNSDDRYRPGALRQVVSWLDSPEPRWLYGRCGIIDGDRPSNLPTDRLVQKLAGTAFLDLQAAHRTIHSADGLFLEPGHLGSGGRGRCRPAHGYGLRSPPPFRPDYPAEGFLVLSGRLPGTSGGQKQYPNFRGDRCRGANRPAACGRTRVAGAGCGVAAQALRFADKAYLPRIINIVGATHESPWFITIIVGNTGET